MMIKSLLWCALIFVFVTGFGYSQTESSEKGMSEDCCQKWYRLVIRNPNPKKVKPRKLSDKELTEVVAALFPKPRKLSEKDFFSAVECLLQLEGNQEKAAFGGATHIKYTGSGRGTDGPVEVAALYYISFLYYDKWDHGSAVNLVDKKGEVDTPETVKKAYESYRKWFKKVKEIGLETAREEELDPLSNIDVRWY